MELPAIPPDILKRQRKPSATIDALSEKMVSAISALDPCVLHLAWQGHTVYQLARQLRRHLIFKDLSRSVFSHWPFFPKLKKINR